MKAHNPFPVLPRAVFLLVALAHPLLAELKWDPMRLDLKPRPSDTVAEGKFGFVNAGKEAVTIEAVKSSCGCTVPTSEKMTHDPGERGEVVARFNIGERKARNPHRSE